MNLKDIARDISFRLVESVRVDEALHGGNVLRLGVGAGQALAAAPRVPLGLAGKVHRERARSLRVHVSHGGLLVQTVQLQHVLVARLRRQTLHLLGGLHKRSAVRHL